MSKLVIIALVSIFATVCQGLPTPQNDIASAAASGNWDQVHDLLEKIYSRMFDFKRLDLLQTSDFDDILKGSVKSLKPVKGGKVYGESEVAFISSSIDGKGQKHVAAGGHKVINDNGKVEEFDIKPKK